MAEKKYRVNCVGVLCSTCCAYYLTRNDCIFTLEEYEKIKCPDGKVKPPLSIPDSVSNEKIKCPDGKVKPPLSIPGGVSNEKGLKYDDGKLNWFLLPKLMLEPVVKVLMMGAKKYKPWNWMEVVSAPGGRVRILNALERHMNAYKEYAADDEESKISHLAHIICNAIFLIYVDTPHATKSNMKERINELQK